MKKENLPNEKIQTNFTEEVKSKDLQKCCQQNSEEKLDEPAWRPRALEFLDLIFDNEQSTLISYQYSKKVDDQWTSFMPFLSYIHFSAAKPDLKSIILGSLDNLDLGIYRFKLLDLYKYDKYWYPCCFGLNGLDQYPVLEINVFENNGVKGFEVINCYHLEEIF